MHKDRSTDIEPNGTPLTQEPFDFPAGEIPVEDLTVIRFTVDERLMAFPKGMTRSEMRAACQHSPKEIYGHIVNWCKQILDMELAKGPDERQGLYQFRNQPLRQDGLLPRAMIRAFSNFSVQFQRSKRRGIVREEITVIEQMMEDIAAVDFYVCVDARRYPEIHVYKLSSARLLNYVYRRRMGLNGLSPRNFDRFIRENFETRWRDIDFNRILRETMERDRLQEEVAAPALPADEPAEAAAIA